jgi:O-acetyl-ADP-ribose deacetylase (regulator of RNase III)/dienelactone hydrolase
VFDLRGHGESQSARITLGHHEQRDLAAALDFVAAQPGVDPDRIGGLGFSMGGAALTLTAATDERLRAVVIEAAFASLEDVIDDKAGLLGPLTQIPARWAIKHEGVDIDSVRPVDALCNISPRPVFLIHGGADDTVPPGSQQRMFDAVCEPADTWLIPAAAHQNYTEVVPDEYAARLLDFFERSLSPLPTALPFFIIAGSNALKVRQIMPIELVSGDLFVNRFKAQAFVHGCNCQGSMGAGIAKRFKELYPAMFEEYRRRCKTEPREFNLGDSFLWQDDSGPWVFNLGTQEQYWHGRATYKAIETALNRMKQQAVDHHIESIAIPRIGTGYGGLSWNKVRGIIETVFEDWSGTLYIYEEYVADQ